MKKEIELKPAEEPKPEEKQEQRPQLLPETLTEKAAGFIIDQAYAQFTTYYNVNQITKTPLPKDAIFYLNEVMLLLKEFDIFHIIE